MNMMRTCHGVCQTNILYFATSKHSKEPTQLHCFFTFLEPKRHTFCHKNSDYQNRNAKTKRHRVLL